MSAVERPDSGAMVRVRIHLAQRRTSLSAARRSSIVNALASTLDCESSEIHELAGPDPEQQRGNLLTSMLGAKRRSPLSGGSGNLLVELLVPDEKAQNLREILRANSPQLSLLKVQQIILESKPDPPETWNLLEGRYVLAPNPPPTPEPVAPVKVRLFQPLLIAIMIGCIVWATVALLHLIVPAWRGSYLIVACVLSALEAGYSQQLLQKRRRFFDDVIKFRAVELLTLIILLKIGSFVGESWLAVWTEIQHWPHEPLRILDLETLGAIVLALLSWMAATGVAQEFARLGEPPEHSRHYVSPLDLLGQRFFLGGGLLVGIAGLTLVGRTLSENSSLSMSSLLRRTPDSPSVGFAVTVLLYFGLGLIMLGQVRFSLLHSAWKEQGIPIDESIAGRWKWASIILITVAIFLAFLLPNSYAAATKMLEWVGLGLAWLLAVIYYLGGILIFLLSWLFGLILSPLMRTPDASPEPAVPPSFAPPVAPLQEPGVTPDWVLLMRSILFWTLIVASVLVVIRIYLRDHPEVGTWFRKFRPFAVLRRLWVTISSWFRRIQSNVQLRLPQLRRDQSSQSRERRRRFPYFRLGALSPRERILYYYWSILRRAERIGFGRRRQETPFEYRDKLILHLSQGEQEMADLTDAFLEARYSKHPLEPGRDQSVRADWQRVKEALRALWRKKEADEVSD